MTGFGPRVACDPTATQEASNLHCRGAEGATRRHPSRGVRRSSHPLQGHRPEAALREHGSVDETLLRHVAPLGWNHIGLTGDYSWHANKRVAKGGYRLGHSFSGEAGS